MAYFHRSTSLPGAGAAVFILAWVIAVIAIICAARSDHVGGRHWAGVFIVAVSTAPALFALASWKSGEIVLNRESGNDVVVDQIIVRQNDRPLLFAIIVIVMLLIAAAVCSVGVIMASGHWDNALEAPN